MRTNQRGERINVSQTSLFWLIVSVRRAEYTNILNSVHAVAAGTTVTCEQIEQWSEDAHASGFSRRSCGHFATMINVALSL